MSNADELEAMAGDDTQLQHVISDQEFCQMNKVSQCECGTPINIHDDSYDGKCKPCREPKAEAGKIQKTHPQTDEWLKLATKHLGSKGLIGTLALFTVHACGLIDRLAEEIAAYTKTNVELLIERDTLAEQLQEFARITGCLDPGEHGSLNECECLCCKVLKG